MKKHMPNTNNSSIDWLGRFDAIHVLQEGSLTMLRRLHARCVALAASPMKLAARFANNVPRGPIQTRLENQSVDCALQGSGAMQTGQAIAILVVQDITIRSLAKHPVCLVTLVVLHQYLDR